MRKTHKYLGFIVLLLSSCASMQIDVPNSELVSYPVKGKQGLRVNQKVSFANYETQYIKRSWNKSHKRAIGFERNEQSILFGRERKKNEMTFILNAADGKTSEVFMINQLRSSNLFLNNRNENTEINIKRYRKKDSLLNSCYAQIYIADEESPWQLRINNAEIDMYKDGKVGEIFLDGTTEYYTVKTVIKTKPKTISRIPVGFQFENKNGEIVGAVSLIDNGAIFLKKDNEKERLLLSSATLVLLLRDEFVD